MPYSPLGPRLTFPFSRYSSSSMLMWFQNEFKPPIYHPLAAAHQCFCKENASYTLWLLSFLCHLGNKKAFIEVDFIICTFFSLAPFSRLFFFIWMFQEIWIKKGGFCAFNKIADGVLQSDERDSELELHIIMICIFLLFKEKMVLLLSNVHPNEIVLRGEPPSVDYKLSDRKVNQVTVNCEVHITWAFKGWPPTIKYYLML